VVFFKNRTLSAATPRDAGYSTLGECRCVLVGLITAVVVVRFVFLDRRDLADERLNVERDADVDRGDCLSEAE
jgi:galactokinase/mevalonate kinase-like predicted kinase